MTYNVIGLMSGSSLDGLDIVFATFTYSSYKWQFEIVQGETIPYSEDLYQELKQVTQLPLTQYLTLHTRLGRYFGNCVNKFIERHQLFHKVHFIASHGHTVWHSPAQHTSVQIGDGATIASVTGINTISDLRNIDVALGGQGAPIVPIADKFLYKDYDFLLNIGGICNVTINTENPLAFDICPANQILNYYAIKAGKEYDGNGELARSGNVDVAIVAAMSVFPYHSLPAPKSLDNSFSQKNIIPLLEDLENNDALSTAVTYIATQIAHSLKPYMQQENHQKILVTGGGAFNVFLIEQIQNTLKQISNVEVVVEDNNNINYKEAVAMAFIGVLRWREEDNVLASVTGASRNSIGGALWLGNQ